MLFAICLPLLVPGLAAAPADTLRATDLDEALIVAQPKETAPLRSQPLSASVFDGGALRSRSVGAVSGLSALAPSFYMPDYGSRLTSAVYVRGIGSRINSSAVGLYVDNIPFTDKTAYHFHFAGVERVDLLRGPQGTLYGAGAMGGVMRVFTADPLRHSGSEVSAGWTSRTGGRRLAASTFLHPSDGLGLSLSAYYTGENGYYRNRTTGDKQDAENVGGARLRLAWRPSDVVRIDWNASYELSREHACPYFWTATDNEGEEATGQIGQNRAGLYRRSLLNTGLSAEHRMQHFTLTSTTAYQHISDRLSMDQDFTPMDIYSLTQRQRIHTLTEEVALKSRTAPSRRWTWTTGAFFKYQALRTTCPVTFHADGLSYLNSQIARGLPSSPSMSVAFEGGRLPFVSSFSTPSLDAALFHQSTVRLAGPLSLTLGLRLDYEHRSLTLRSGAEGTAVPYRFALSMGPTMSFETDLEADPTLNARLTDDRWIVQPKGALNCALPHGLGHVYASVAKGYRPGGYNIQSYSDLSQQALRRAMMTGVAEYSAAQINALAYLPEATRQRIIAAMTGAITAATPDEADARSLYYKPEYTWSYEAGTHLNLLDRALTLNVAAYYMTTRDQQLARFAESGMGRRMVNAGRSRSLGAEVSVSARLLSERLRLYAAYGFTRATFTAYDLGMNQGQTVDYTGHRVPFVPAHTLALTADYTQPLRSPMLRAFTLGADLRAAGDVWWDEANTFSQPFYATLGAYLRLDLAHGLSATLSGRNLTATRYATFSFESMNRRFAQYADPRSFSVDLRWTF